MNSSSPNSTNPSPQQTYRLMTAMGLILALLFGLAVYSYSRLTNSPWNRLATPDLQITHRKDLPQIERLDSWPLLKPQYLHGKWTLLSFWTITCAPCLLEIPAMNELAHTWQGPEFQILTVNLDKEGSEELEAARRFYEQQQIELPMLLDHDKILQTAFAVTEYPKHFLIDPSGKIVWEALGAFQWNSADVRNQILKLMEQHAPSPSEDPLE